MNRRSIDWIWHIRGSLALAPGQSSDEAFDRLDALFREAGTSHERINDTLTFRKQDQAAQDKMSVFDRGVLQIEKGAAGSVLRYHLTSRTLLFCFLAPLLFLVFAALTTAIVRHPKLSSEAAAKLGKAPDASKSPGKEDAVLSLNPIDKALGAPAPEKPKGADKAEGQHKKLSSTPAYVFAAIFAVLYVVGRVLESRLVKTLFEKRLLDSSLRNDVVP